MSFLLMYGTDEVFYAALVTATASACTALGRGTCRRCRAQTLSALACCRRLEQSTCLWTKPWQVGPGQGPHQEDSGRAAENFCVESAISFLTHALANLAGKNQLLIKLKITSFLPLMKMHFIFKGFSIQTEHALTVFLRNASGLWLVGRVHEDQPECLKCSHWPTALYWQKGSGKIFQSVLPKLSVLWHWYEGRH